MALGDDIEKELGGLDLRSRMFNGRFANPEANRLRDEFRSLFYFNEALIPLMKKGGVDRVQLYDLSKDIGQQNDIANKRPKLVARLKKQANLIYKSVMADGPEYGTPEEEATAKKLPEINALQRPAAGASDTDTANLLARIDKNPFPRATREAATRLTSTRSWPVSNPNSASGSANSGKKNAASILTYPTREPPSSGFSLTLPGTLPQFGKKPIEARIM